MVLAYVSGRILLNKDTQTYMRMVGASRFIKNFLERGTRNSLALICLHDGRMRSNQERDWRVHRTLVYNPFYGLTSSEAERRPCPGGFLYWHTKAYRDYLKVVMQKTFFRAKHVNISVPVREGTCQLLACRQGGDISVLRDVAIVRTVWTDSTTQQYDYAIAFLGENSATLYYLFDKEGERYEMVLPYHL